MNALTIPMMLSCKSWRFSTSRTREWGVKKNDIRSAEQVRVETCDSRKCEMSFIPEFLVALLCCVGVLFISESINNGDVEKVCEWGMPILSTPSFVSWDRQLLFKPWSHFPYFAFTVIHNIARWLLTRRSYFLNHQLKWTITSITPPSNLQHQTLLFPSPS